MTTTAPHQTANLDVLIWAGEVTDPGTVTDHFAGLHDGAPQAHCPRCAR